MVRINTLAFLGGQSLGDGHAFYEANDGDQDCWNQKRTDQIAGQARHSQGWQTLRYIAHDLHALFRKTKAPDRNGSGDNRDHRATLGQKVSQHRSGSEPFQKGFEIATHPKQKPRRADADHKGDPVGVTQMGKQRLKHLWQRVTMRANTKYVFYLTCSDQDPGRCDKACDYGMAEEIRQKAQPQHAK